VSAAASLYRRHRPRAFADVVGQEHVVRTLRNAVEHGKVHHAYLFVGSRGTGKTSMAKILAASLNCVNGPTTSPCGVCESCVSIAGATSMDVIEMDAASNNSVEDIRDLRERVGYAPVTGRYKVYILDEAHMLSSAAWNAFLKTLEEPPPNTIFVLATTEAQKVLPTVVDRCHRFDFGRPSVPQIATVLRRAAEAEGIEVSDQALGLIARGATGSFRDGLGTLEQLVTYSGGEIALEDVLAVLGVADAELLFEAVEAIATHDARRALLTVARLAESGRDAGQYYKDLEGHLRQLLVVQTLGEVPEALRLTAEHDQRVSEQAARVAGIDVSRALDHLNAALHAVRDGADERVQLELALVKAAAPKVDPSARALLSRLEQLEARLGAGGAVAPAPAPAVAPTPAEAAAPPPPAPAPRPEPAAAPEPVRPPAEAGAGNGAAAARAPEPEPAPVATATIAPGAPLDLERVLELWPAVVESVRERAPLTAALLEHGRVTGSDGDRITLAFHEVFFKKKAEDRTNQRLVVEALRMLTGRSLAVDVELREATPEAEEAVPATAISEDEWIRRFVTEFEAEEIEHHDTEEGQA
jgi:DNA polymerase-3 subunit gamma/tau